MLQHLHKVGSPDFGEPGLGQVDMVVSARQPGSALKPFLFALAFDRGHTAATVVPDVPRSYSTTLEPSRAPYRVLPSALHVSTL
jgi:penicillin-binding protein 1C